MEALIALITPELLPVVESAVEKFAPGLLAKVPGLGGKLLLALFKTGMVQAELQKYEAMGVDELAALAQKGLDEIKALIAKEIAAHPVLGSILAKVEGDPAISGPLSLGADEVRALLASKAKGEWNAVRALVGLSAQ